MPYPPCQPLDEAPFGGWSESGRHRASSVDTLLLSQKDGMCWRVDILSTLSSLASSQVSSFDSVPLVVDVSAFSLSPASQPNNVTIGAMIHGAM